MSPSWVRVRRQANSACVWIPELPRQVVYTTSTTVKQLSPEHPKPHLVLVSTAEVRVVEVLPLGIAV